MAKSYKIKNLIIVIVMITISCLELRAAVVSDSTGSAFITKNEFEELKTSFNDQLENYNASIDHKVDGAIANYIKGLDVVQRTQKNVLNSDWKEVSCLNGVLDNTFKVPELNLQFCVATMFRSPDEGIGTANADQTTGGYTTSLSHFSNLVYTENWNTITNCYRNLVTCTGPNPTNVGDIIWDGQAVRYKEKYQINRSIMKWVHWSWGDRAGDETYSVMMRNLSTLKQVGYFTNWDSVKLTGWPIGYLWTYTARPSPASGSSSSGTTTVTFAANEVNDNFATSVVLDADSEGKKKRYEHIINYDSDTEWRVSNPSWLTLINAPSESSITSSTVMSTASRSERGIFCGCAMHVVPHQVVMENLPIGYEITDNSITPCIGLFINKRKAKDMYQDNVKSNINIDKNEYVEKIKPKLHQGFQLLAVKEGDKITWEPVFKYTHVHNSATTYVDNSHEVDIYVASEPFTNQVTSTKTLKVKVDGGNVEKDYATTTTTDGKKKCKIEFTAPKDGIIYVKWIPHFTGTSYLNDDWIVTLDLEKSNTYVYIRE